MALEATLYCCFFFSLSFGKGILKFIATFCLLLWRLLHSLTSAFVRFQSPFCFHEFFLFFEVQKCLKIFWGWSCWSSVWPKSCSTAGEGCNCGCWRKNFLPATIDIATLLESPYTQHSGLKFDKKYCNFTKKKFIYWNFKLKLTSFEFFFKWIDSEEACLMKKIFQIMLNLDFEVIVRSLEFIFFIPLFFSFFGPQTVATVLHGARTHATHDTTHTWKQVAGDSTCPLEI